MAKILWGLAGALGVLLTGLGVLWALQGADLVHIEPVACVAHCESVEGFSTKWLVAGIVTLVVGLTIAWQSIRRVMRIIRSSRPQG